eukprot:365442-Chlamydomonas_euryale.AAC.8
MMNDELHAPSDRGRLGGGRTSTTPLILKTSKEDVAFCNLLGIDRVDVHLTVVQVLNLIRPVKIAEPQTKPCLASVL